MHMHMHMKHALLCTAKNFTQFLKLHTVFFILNAYPSRPRPVRCSPPSTHMYATGTARTHTDTRTTHARTHTETHARIARAAHAHAHTHIRKL